MTIHRVKNQTKNYLFKNGWEILRGKNQSSSTWTRFFCLKKHHRPLKSVGNLEQSLWVSPGFRPVKKKETLNSEWQQILEINVEAHKNRNYLPNVYKEWMNHSNRKNLVLLKTINDVERIIGFFSVCWYESGDRTVFGTARYYRFDEA